MNPYHVSRESLKCSQTLVKSRFFNDFIQKFSLYLISEVFWLPVGLTKLHSNVNYSPPSRCTRLEEGASIRRSLVSRLRGVKFTGRFLTVQTLQTILCSELTPASQPVLCKVILYSQYILSECCV